MGTFWVDFKDLKRRLRFDAVLAHHGVRLTGDGDQRTGFCPLPSHKGDGSSPSFSANVERGIWQCFGCGAKGNVLDFAVLMEGKSPDDPREVRRVALAWQERIGRSGPTRSKAEAPRSEGRRRKVDERVVVNQPLDFELKGLDARQPYFLDRGFTEETLARFGVAYCSRGLMKGRQVIPIHDPAGRLVAYAGRIVDDALVSHDTPKYLLPSAKEHDGVHHEFRKSLVLYNAHRVVEPAASLVVVEGFPSVWWLWQHGYRDAVSLMGASCSPEQAEAILGKVPDDGIVLAMPDGDEAGVRCAHSIFDAIGSARPVRWVRLGAGKQPTDLDDSELARSLYDY